MVARIGHHPTPYLRILRFSANPRSVKAVRNHYSKTTTQKGCTARKQSLPNKNEYGNGMFAANIFTGAANARVKLEQVSASETVERGCPDWRMTTSGARNL